MIPSNQVTILRPNRRAVTAAIPLSRDGTPQTGNVTASSLLLPAFTSSNANDVVCVGVTTNGYPVTSVTGGGLTFARHPGLTPPTAGSSSIELWYAFAASAVSAVQFTINVTSSAYTTGLVFAVTGGKTSGNPFSASGPSTDSGTTTALITAAETNTFAIGMAVNPGNASVNGFTVMDATANGNFLLVSYKIVSAPLVNQLWDDPGLSGTIGTAIVQGP